MFLQKAHGKFEDMQLQQWIKKQKKHQLKVIDMFLSAPNKKIHLCFVSFLN